MTNISHIEQARQKVKFTLENIERLTILDIKQYLAEVIEELNSFKKELKEEIKHEFLSKNRVTILNKHIKTP